MSLPLTRRIAKAALLTAASAASVVGVAGAASAADQQQPANLGGLTNVDGADVNGALQDTTSPTGSLTSAAGDGAVRSGVPAATEATTGAVDETVRGTTQEGLPDTGLRTDQLPTGGLPLS